IRSPAAAAPVRLLGARACAASLLSARKNTRRTLRAAWSLPPLDQPPGKRRLSSRLLTTTCRYSEPPHDRRSQPINLGTRPPRRLALRQRAGGLAPAGKSGGRRSEGRMSRSTRDRADASAKRKQSRLEASREAGNGSP